ncbi:MAG: RIP metalloprotease RseP [Lachnospiraceae bacterium]|nr:RIP metalloprotease RseP [Lachnospiraceae bacterium]
MNILLAVLVFSLLVVTHELGHFLLAKKNGVGVPEFCIGFGPKLLCFEKGGTEYSLRLIPFGGACIMEGEDEDSDAENSFPKKSPWARLSILAAGPFFNFLTAYILAVVVIGTVGIDKPYLSAVPEGMPAEEAGLLEGDLITRMNGKTIKSYRDVSLFFMNYDGKDEITVGYERDGKAGETVFRPAYDEERNTYYMGVSVYTYRRPVDHVLEALGLGFHEVKYWMEYTWASLGMLFTGRVPVTELSGPVGIVSVVNDVVEESKTDGAFYVFINLANISLLLSVNLGVMNLLPFPALDGGRILFILFELIRGKPVPSEKEGIVHMVGMVLLMLLMTFVFYNDIVRLIGR